MRYLQSLEKLHDFDFACRVDRRFEDRFIRALPDAFRTCAASFLRASRQYEVSAILLTAIAAVESGWGRRCPYPNDLFGLRREGFPSPEQSIGYGAAVAAIGVAAHEAGHAVQYAVGYTPMKVRAAIIPLTKFGSTLAWPLIILGLILNFSELMIAGVLLFGTATLFQLVTLPVEINASSRAMCVLRETHILSDTEAEGGKKVLRAAALTYVAGLAASVLQLLRLIILAGGRDRD